MVKKANQAISWCCIFSICNTVSKLHLLGYLSPFQAYILCVLNKFEAKLRFQSNARKWFIMTHGGIYWNMWNKWLRTRGKRALCFLLASTKRNMVKHKANCVCHNTGLHHSIGIKNYCIDNQRICKIGMMFKINKFSNFG